jgi:rfaE bifunctional protein nucleotidyltransferase chain/domain
VTAPEHDQPVRCRHEGAEHGVRDLKASFGGARPRRVIAPEARAPRDKIRPIAEVGEIARRLRAKGTAVVQAHGTFDLLHLGHVRHFEAARRLGDALVVTVTGDLFVDKGAGRPVFPEALRAEMIAALEFVDWVAINPSPDAVSAIEAIRPVVYVKGDDYRDEAGDVTGRIAHERRAVEKHGGRIEFTREMTFSSSALLNQHFDIYEPRVRELVSELRADGGLAETLALIERTSAFRVLLVGDAIIDDYQYVFPMAKSTKESMIATRFQSAETFAGGVLAAANHIAAFCAQVEVVTCLGDEPSYEELIRASLKPNVRLHILRRQGAPTTLKRRFIDPSYMHKLFEVYVMNDEPLSDELEEPLRRLIAELAPGCDVVVVTDFGHGLIGPSSIECQQSKARFLAVNAQSNSANLGYNLVTRYRRADYLCIDAPEARLAMGDRISAIGDVAQALLRDRVDCPKMIVTHGKNGCVTCERGGSIHAIPAFAKHVVDTVGAGDAFFAVTAPIVAAGGTLRRVGFIGNVVGALKVEIVGHRRPVEKPSVVKAITSLLR